MVVTNLQTQKNDPKERDTYQHNDPADEKFDSEEYNCIRAIIVATLTRATIRVVMIFTMRTSARISMFATIGRLIARRASLIARMKGNKRRGHYFLKRDA